MNDSDRNESSRLAVLTSRQSRLSALVGGCVLVLATSGAAHAKTVNVNSTCTLAEAFQTVNTQVAQPGCTFTGTANPDLILVPSGTFTQTTSLELNRSATVRGNGVGVTILRGNSTSYFLRAVDLNPPVSTNALTVTFEQMTIDHTTSSVVNGIYANQVLLQVLKARVTGFKTSGIWGDDADMLIEDSTIENNTSSASGGGVLFLNPLGSQAIKNASLHINRSTIASSSSRRGTGWGSRPGATIGRSRAAMASRASEK